MRPFSGKDGYMIWDGIEIPLYSWLFSGINQRTEFKLSNSLNFPVRKLGPTQESIVLKGADVIPAFYTDSTLLTTMSFEIGWLDFLTDLRRKILVSAMMTEYSMAINYTSNVLPSFMWTANLIGVLTNKEFDVENLTINDEIICGESNCDKTITTTDVTLNGGFVQHIRTANITYSFDRPQLVLSNSNNHLTSTIGTFDSFIDLTIEGDFDYWIEQINSDTRFNYRFFVSDTSFIVYNMKVLEFNNLNINIQTGEMISANVRLGASYE